jgi:hypothetical protein
MIVGNENSDFFHPGLPNKLFSFYYSIIEAAQIVSAGQEYHMQRMAGLRENVNNKCISSSYTACIHGAEAIDRGRLLGYDERVEWWYRFFAV